MKDFLSAKVLRKIINIKYIFLLGSVARKNTDLKSDIDILVVSDDFKGIIEYKRKELVNKYLISSREVDAFCFTNSEFNRIKNRNRFIDQTIFILEDDYEEFS